MTEAVLIDCFNDDGPTRSWSHKQQCVVWYRTTRPVGLRKKCGAVNWIKCEMLLLSGSECWVHGNITTPSYSSQRQRR